MCNNSIPYCRTGVCYSRHQTKMKPVLVLVKFAFSDSPVTKRLIPIHSHLKGSYFTNTKSPFITEAVVNFTKIFQWGVMRYYETSQSSR